MKFTDWEIWMACMHPPVQKYASPEYINNPENWGPKLPAYKTHLNSMTRGELVNLYLQIDDTSPSMVSWRRKLLGTTGPSSKIRAGTPALVNLVSNGRHSSGSYRYYSGSALGIKNLAAHRVVYFLKTGEWPEVVDHIDGNPLNNHPDNLRGSTHVKNAQNRRKGQVKGFMWRERDLRFYVKVAGVYISSPKDMLTARADYVRAYVDKYGHFPEP